MTSSTAGRSGPSPDPAPASDRGARASGEGGSGGAPGDADRVATAVLAVPGVVRLHAGRLGEVGTYLPGRRVPGVRLLAPGGADLPQVHVVVDGTTPLSEVAARVRSAAAGVLGSAVDVVIGDLEPPTTPDTPLENP